MPLELVRQDITRMQVDAIVNAANNRLAQGGGVCGAIFAAAGAEQLTRACQAIGHCETGQAVLTSGFALPAKYIIHTVGPVWQEGKKGEEELLRSCYIQSLRLAKEKRCQSVAFPLISSGIYGYPKGEALAVAMGAIRSFLTQEADLSVSLVLFDRSTLKLSEGLLGRVQSYIDDHYVDTYPFFRRSIHDRPSEQNGAAGSMQHSFSASDVCFQSPQPAPLPGASPAKTEHQPKRSLRDLLFHMEESFSQMLLRLVDEKGMTDVQVYRRANLDRKLFSKLRKKDYTPSRQTAMALAIALRLNLDETKDLLARAGYTLSPCSKFDIIVQYFITEGIYDIDQINQVLFSFDQKLLGG